MEENLSGISGHMTSSTASTSVDLSMDRDGATAIHEEGKKQGLPISEQRQKTSPCSEQRAPLVEQEVSLLGPELSVPVVEEELSSLAQERAEVQRPGVVTCNQEDIVGSGVKVSDGQSSVKGQEKEDSVSTETEPPSGDQLYSDLSPQTRRRLGIPLELDSKQTFV
jgi:hypothetical protein